MPHGHAIHCLVQETGKFRPCPGGRKFVQNEQIHPYMIQLSLIVLHFRAVLMAFTFFVNDSGSKIIKCLSAPVTVRLQKLHGIRQLPWSHLHKRLILVPGKRHIRVIIPGDEPLMAYSAYKGARVQHVADIILAANPVYLF